MNSVVTKRKRLLSMITALFLLLATISVVTPMKAYADTSGTAYTDDRNVGGSIYYELDAETNTVTISDCDETVTRVVIPDKITVNDTDYAVTGIGIEAFSGCTNLTEVTIPASVIDIGSGAFDKCDNLRIYGYTDSYAKTYANENNIPFLVITSPDDVPVDTPTHAPVEPMPPKVEVETVHIKIPVSGGNLLLLKEGYRVITQSNSGDKIIEGGTIYRCDSTITEAVIPESAEGTEVKKIGNRTFSKCNDLTSVTIPGSIKDIGEYTFYKCEKLKNVTIMDGITEIGYSVFAECRSLTDITIPDSVKSIGYNAFSNCQSLTEIDFPDGLTGIGDSAFSGCSGLTGISIPNSVRNIGNGAFANCIGITEITVPESVTLLGNTAFAGCTNLTKVTIPVGVTGIGRGAFDKCDNLTIYGYTGSYAETYAKENNIPFMSIGTVLVSINDAVISKIPNQTYTGKALEPQISVTLNGKVLTGGTDYEVSYSDNINVGKATVTVTGIGKYTGKATESFNIVAPPERKPNPDKGKDMKDKDGKHRYEVIKSEGGDVEVSYKAPENKKEATVKIPDTVVLEDGTVAEVTAINDKAFKNNKKVKKITIGKNVENVGKEAFSGCKNLNTVKMGKSVKNIGNNAFAKCPKLKAVTVPSKVAKIGKKAFSGCKNLKSITIKTTKLTNSNVGKQAFKGVSPKAKVRVPKSKVKVYKKLFVKKGLPKKAKVTK